MTDGEFLDWCEGVLETESYKGVVFGPTDATRLARLAGYMHSYNNRMALGASAVHYIDKARARLAAAVAAKLTGST